MRPATHLFFLLGLCLLAFQANASIVITGTRVVYPAAERDITVNIRNTGRTPSLIKAWVDNGKGTPGADKQGRSPFIVTPPVSRVDPDKGLLLRIANIDRSLPQDRESVFWLNVLEVPSSSPDKADAAASNNSAGKLQVAFRSQLKLFYRPAKLKGVAADAAQQLKWRIVSEGGKSVLRAVNDLPYSVSLARLQLRSGARQYDNDDLDMVPAKGAYGIALPRDAAAWARPGARLRYTWINDFGGLIETEATVE